MGRIRRLDGKIMKITCYKNRYCNIWIDGKGLQVHRLVAIAFLATPEEGQIEINHLNGNKHDNRVSNLEWATKIENSLHSYHILGNQSIHCLNQPRMPRLIKEDVIDKIVSLADAGLTLTKIAEKTGVDRTTAFRHVSSAIACGRISRPARFTIDTAAKSEIRRLHENGAKPARLMEMFSIGRTSVYRIIRGKDPA